MNDVLRMLLGLPEQASSVARAIDYLHFTVILSTMLGAAVVGLIAIWFAIRYRRRSTNAATPRVTAGFFLECGLISGTLLLFIGWWWVGYLQYLNLQVPPDDALTIRVSAKQWMWKFSYPDGQRSLSLLVVPEHRPIKLVMSSRDVIHGFSVPAFRLKRDVVPGTLSVTWFEAVKVGVYPILCAEFCGTSHSKMRGVVVVLPATDYAAWLDGSHAAIVDVEQAFAAERQAMFADDESQQHQPQALLDPIARGRAAALRHGCFSCHTQDGQRHIGPTWLGLYNSQVSLRDGGSVRADAAYLTRSMMDPLADIVAGYQPLMPSYHGLIDPDDAAAIVEFIMTLEKIPAPEQPNPLPSPPYRVDAP